MEISYCYAKYYKQNISIAPRHQNYQSQLKLNKASSHNTTSTILPQKILFKIYQEGEKIHLHKSGHQSLSPEVNFLSI